ncbi:peroxisomal membrane protein pmp47a [Ophiostoma piceae UAMH 11346]|uniref:Peroxisomal membrane protein pmp47a n=1 Tax=Ophiostoma piceae (strain UAMH 11346) TaxID=1262450 RepID=S3CBX9_OPHP1|nr:peroxisomal membrane protein pmp47a [Ophiostoma piceae UAMH 11346]
MAPVASKPVADVAAPTSIPANDNVAHAIAGAGGGILSTVVTYPLITLSTRAQVESRRADSSFLKAVKDIVAREGVSGLYAGLDSAIFGIGVTNFVYYYWYEWARAAFQRRAGASPGRVAGQLSTLESMLAGALAGSATVILTNPIWVINTRMTTRGAEEKAEKKEGEAAAAAADPEAALAEKKIKKTTVGTLLALLREEGPHALFAGVVPALVLVINPILQYTLFEQLKNSVQKRRPVTPGIAFVLGALGKLFATSITYPYITVKSRMHVSSPEERQGGVTAALRRVVQKEGYAGLYKGIGPKVTQSVLTAAFLFALKDVLYNQTVQLRSRAKVLRA